MSNHIEHIEIKNFKSIRHQTIEGCKRINVFIGYPNVGKSAILEAIAAFSYLQKDFIVPFPELSRFRLPIELFHNGVVANEISVSYSDTIRVRISYKDEHSMDFFVEERHLETSENGTKSGLIGQWDWLKIINYVNNTIGGASNRMKNDILSVKKYVFQNNFNEVRTNGLVLESPFGKNIVDIVQSNQKLRKEIIELFKFYDLELNIDQRINSMFGFKRLGDGLVYTIPFYQMADTLQRLIFHKAAVLSNENSVLLFEEPEAHMFPPYISQFTSDIIYNKSNNNQYFISTHSPFVVNDFMEDARDELSVFMVGLKNGETIVKRLSDEEMHEVYQHGVDLFFNIQSYLD